MVFAVLAGAGNFREAGDRAADLPRPLLDAAGTRRDPRTGELAPPSGSTLRRVTEDIDVDAVGPAGVPMDRRTGTTGR